MDILLSKKLIELQFSLKYLSWLCIIREARVGEKFSETQVTPFDVLMLGKHEIHAADIKNSILPFVTISILACLCKYNTKFKIRLMCPTGSIFF